MTWSFAWAHWILTLLVAPLTDQAIHYIWGEDPSRVVGLLSVYPLAAIIGFVISVPTLIVYMTSFFFLLKYKMHIHWAKIILIEISVMGIYITQTMLGGSMSKDIIIAYSVTSIIVGLYLPLRNNRKIIWEVYTKILMKVV